MIPMSRVDRLTDDRSGHQGGRIPESRDIRSGQGVYGQGPENELIGRIGRTRRAH